MKRVLLLVVCCVAYTPLVAQESKVDFPAEIARIFALKKAGQKALDEGKLDAAATAYQEATDAQTKILGADNPETLDTMRALAGVFEKQERWEDLYRLREALFDSQTRTEGKVTDDVAWGAAMAAFSWGAELYGKVGEPPKDLERARDLIRRLRERSQPFDGTLTTENALGMTAYWNEAWTECKSGNPRQAIASLLPGIKCFPQNSWGHMAMALFCWQADEKDVARDWYLAACEGITEAAGPDAIFDDLKERVTAIMFAGEAAPVNIDPLKYVGVYDRLVSAYPDAMPLHTRRGVSLVRVGRSEQALPDFRKALETRPDDAWNWYNLAFAALHSGHVDEYQKTCQGMYAKFAESSNPFDRHLLIIVWSLAPNPEIDAAKMLELANRPDRTDDSRVARVLYRCGRFDEALALLATKPDGIVLALTEYARGNKPAAERNIVGARPFIQSGRNPVTNYFEAGRSVMEAVESEIVFNEAQKLLGMSGQPVSWGRFAQLLAGDWTARGTITGAGESQVLKSGDKFTMVASFRPAAGGRALVGTQTLTVVDRPHACADSSVMFAWDPTEAAVRIIACWSDGAIEIGSLTAMDDCGLRGGYVIHMPDGRQESAEIAMEIESPDKFSWVFKSGPNAGKCLSTWQRNATPPSGQ